MNEQRDAGRPEASTQADQKQASLPRRFAGRHGTIPAPYAEQKHIRVSARTVASVGLSRDIQIASGELREPFQPVLQKPARRTHATHVSTAIGPTGMARCRCQDNAQWLAAQHRQTASTQRWQWRAEASPHEIHIDFVLVVRKILQNTTSNEPINDNARCRNRKSKQQTRSRRMHAAIQQKKRERPPAPSDGACSCPSARDRRRAADRCTCERARQQTRAQQIPDES
jgi:hypothetical protein